MITGTIVPEVLLYIALPIIALSLFVVWLIYASRGGRAVTLNFKGFGVDVNINTSAAGKTAAKAKESNV